MVCVLPEQGVERANAVVKFTAVNIPALTAYVDVIVFSIKGARSPASLLGGGMKHLLSVMHLK